MCVCGCVYVCLWMCVCVHPSVLPSIHPSIHPTSYNMRNRLHQTMRLFLRACSKDLFYSCWFGIGLHYYLYLHMTFRLVRMQWRRKLRGQDPRWVPMEPDGRGDGARTPMFQTFNQ